MKKRIIALVLVAILVSATLIGCGSDSGTVSGEGTKVGLVLAGGLGDRSFYDSANEGVEEAKEKLGIDFKVYECRNDPSLYNDQMVQASQYADIVAVVGHEFGDLILEIPTEFPEVHYIYVDSEIEGIDNVTTVSYAENEGSFLAGALAAMLTTDTSIEGMNADKKIGMVGGMDIPVIRNFLVGYEAGAKYIDPDMEVIPLFAEDFEDPAKGKESATVLYDRGADIVFAVAGKTGEGVFEAAKELDRYAIGVDTDQRYINPESIVASMVKRVGKSIYEVIEIVENGDIEPGKVVYYGLSQDGVGMGYGTDDMVQYATEEMKIELEDIKTKIVSGEIEVPAGK